VAAVSYYVVSLSGYFLKGIPFIYDVVTALMSVLVPVVMLSIWWRVRRIRHAHEDSTALESSDWQFTGLKREKGKSAIVERPLSEATIW